MSERTIQHMARELAGTFYDMVRSAEKVLTRKFKYPNVDATM